MSCWDQVLYTVAVTVLFPGSILALAAGAVFGLVLGSLLVWLGTVLGQTLAFIIGRFASFPSLSSFAGSPLTGFAQMQPRAACGYRGSRFDACWCRLFAQMQLKH